MRAPNVLLGTGKHIPFWESMVVKRVYYARPIQAIGTDKDAANIQALRKLYPGAAIDAVTSAECAAKKGQLDSMTPFFARVDKCDLVVVAEVARNHVSSGVFAEAQHALHRSIPVQVIRSGVLSPVGKLEVVTNPVHKHKWARIQR